MDSPSQRIQVWQLFTRTSNVPCAFLVFHVCPFFRVAWILGDKDFLGARKYNEELGQMGPFIFETYSQASKRIVNVAAALKSIDIKEKACVGLYSVNRPEWVDLRLKGSWLIGFLGDRGASLFCRQSHYGSNIWHSRRWIYRIYLFSDKYGSCLCFCG